MADPHALDLDALRRWWSSALPALDGEIEAHKFSGGQSNPTYAIHIAGTPRYVLRKKPPGVLLPSAHAVEREYRVTDALKDSAVPVARPLALCEDASVIGTPFFVMDYVAGRNFWDARLPGMDLAERKAIYQEMNRSLAALHAVDPEAVGLAEFGRPGDYFGRQVARWTKQYRATQTSRIEAMERLIDWLPANNPGRAESRIVHGDFRNDNMIFDECEPKVRAILDWELSTLGDPLADLAQHMMAWRVPHEGYRGLADVDLAALGIPSEAWYLESYCERRGIPVPPPETWAYALAFATFRNAAIRQGVFRRALDGNASSDVAARHGALAADIAGLGWQIASADRDAKLTAQNS
ncbi:phosphotransferase family protein [Novosphingobium aquimarinum]|uniref:phosphotransferase family protein n=1 Tax=Novosphingobium aquimarinum TaxID=2682494 RepID=UPI0012EBE650|nr:phosphotransferase family protein [Novosphingobium aquimarinum]